jgi:hypothetical protein
MALWRAVDATTGKSKTGLVKSAEDIQVEATRVSGLQLLAYQALSY